MTDTEQAQDAPPLVFTDAAADKVMQMMARNVNGRLTAAEALRHEEFVITKLYQT